MTNLLLLGFLPSGSEWIIIALVILLLFGGKKIPELMRGLGKGVKSFKDGVNEAKEEINKALALGEIQGRRLVPSRDYTGHGTAVLGIS